MKTLRLSLVASALALSLGLAGPAAANSTSSSIKGYVTGPAKGPAAGTVVTITHVPSGTSKQATVNASGVFSAQGLRVGGPYTITVDSNSFEDQTINNVYLSLGETYQLEVSLKSQANVERIEVSGQVVSSNFGSTSPATHFNLSDLEAAPSVNRDIKDTVRVDPRVYVNESGGSDSIQCAGNNPRYNSLTVDGVRMNDNFGLNSNGYPTERMPFSYDAIDQVAVELAPFDVTYGGFTACNINAVTKSGTNEFSGSAFFDYTNDSMSGDEVEGKKVELGNYNVKRYGFNMGMPIIEDKLFFFVAYEELEGSANFQYDALDNQTGVSQATIDRIVQIARDKYNYDPGSLVPSMPVFDEKLLMKLDWNISDEHRASFVYNYNDGNTISPSDAGSNRLSLSNHFYERGAELNSFVGSLYSDWSDNWTTELRLGYSELDNRQVSIDQASGFGEMQIRAENGVTVYIGPDDSRQANKLKYDNWSFKFANTLYLGDHTLTFGYERETLDVFNMFVQHVETETRFSSVDDFENGAANRIYYGNASSHNPEDAAGQFEYAINTVYLQDEYEFLDLDLTVTYGLRYERYESDDLPTHNPLFETRHGFSNSQNLDGKDLLQPRLGFNWSVDDALEVRGGVGLYSGGNPNVWVSNSYSNDGIRNIQIRTGSVQVLGPDAIEFVGGTAGYGVPASLYDQVGTSTANSDTNVTDPNFEIPSEWKWSLGATYTTESDYVFTADILYSDKQDSAVIYDLAKVKTGEAPDGRPLYGNADWSGTDTAGFRGADFVLTNVGGDYVKGADARSTVLSFSVAKAFENGFKFSASYAYTDAKDVHPMTSSVAFSNYHYIAVSDPQRPELARSNYEIPHRFTLNMSYVQEFVEGYETKVSLFGQANEGHPYTYSFTDRSGGFGYNDADRQLLYIPTENDSKVVYADGFDLAAFNAWIKSEGLEGYRGQILDRNVLDSDWWVKFDFRIEQQLPGFYKDHKASAYFVLENVGNFLNDDWGVLKQGNLLQGAVEADIVDGHYEFQEFTNPQRQSTSNSASLWQIRLGVKYKF